MNALGKVLRRGKHGDFERFREFLSTRMKYFLAESDTLALPATPSGHSGGDRWLYEVFRCGFVHAFYPAGDVRWGRNEPLTKYWWYHRSTVTLNIDELVRGFRRGMLVFRHRVYADPDLASQFKEDLLAN
jgi:hypothetical protein